MKKLKVLGLVGLMLGNFVFSCSRFEPVNGFINSTLNINNFVKPSKMDIDKNGNLYVLDDYKYIKKVFQNGTSETILSNLDSDLTFKIKDDYLYFSTNGKVKKLYLKDKSKIEYVAGIDLKDVTEESKKSDKFEDFFFGIINDMDFDKDGNLILLNHSYQKLIRLNFESKKVEQLELYRDNQNPPPDAYGNQSKIDLSSTDTFSLNVNKKTNEIFVLNEPVDGFSEGNIIKISTNNIVSDYSKELYDFNIKEKYAFGFGGTNIFIDKDGNLYTYSNSEKMIFIFDMNKKLKNKIDLSQILPFIYPEVFVRRGDYQIHFISMSFNKEKNILYVSIMESNTIFKIFL